MEMLTDECTFEAFNHTEQLVLSLTILRWSDAVRDVNEFGNAERSVCYLSDPKLFRLVLKVSYFSFQSILACRGSQKLHFGDLGLT